MVARVGRGECGARDSVWRDDPSRTWPWPRGAPVGAPGSERPRGAPRGTSRDRPGGQSRTRGRPSRCRGWRRRSRGRVLGARAPCPFAGRTRRWRGPAMRRRAAAAQRRGQVLGREHLPRRGVPEVHVRVRRVRENRPRGLGRGGASLEGEGKRGTRGERVVGQQNACVVRDDRMGFFKTRGERGGTITRAPSQTWRATPRETSAATPPRPSPSATRPGSSSHRANRTEDRERQTRHVIISRRRAKTRWNERAAAVDR